MPKLVAVLLAAVLAAVALASCGGGDSSTSEASSTSAPQSSTGTSGSSEGKGRPEKKAETGKSPQPKSASNGSSRSGSSGGSAAVPPLKVSGGGSAQFKTKGGDNSIQEYGEEDESELQQAAEALHGFYVARAGGEWAKACSYMAATVVKQFEELASRSPQLKDKGCAAVLHAFTRPLPASAQRETTAIDAASLRREGERAFLIYKGGDGKPYTIPMVLEGGAWKVGSVAGTPLSF
jgi:hypothetical protein